MDLSQSTSRLFPTLYTDCIIPETNRLTYEEYEDPECEELGDVTDFPYSVGPQPVETTDEFNKRKEMLRIKVSHINSGKKIIFVSSN